MSQMILTSTAFADNFEIPIRYTCEGEDISPPLAIAGVPAQADSLALLMSDPDAPTGVWFHWVLWNIHPATAAIPENGVPTGAVEGTNSWGRRRYGGPCPLRGSHRYIFQLYALKQMLTLPPSTGGKELERAMRGMIVGRCDLLAIDSRSGCTVSSNACFAE